MDRAQDEPMRAHSEFVAGDNFLGNQQVSWSTWYLQPTESGIYGTPTAATAETGRTIMEAAVENGARFLRQFWNHQPTAGLR